MHRGKIIASALVALVIAAIVENSFGSTRYQLNSASFDVPHQYDFGREVRWSWLADIKGLDDEPDESIWLSIPAVELARDIPGYSRTFHGYDADQEADVIVNVIGGSDAGVFPKYRADQLKMVAEAVARGEGREPDRTTGWERIYSMRSTKGAGSIFYLLPVAGAQSLPSDWLPPICDGSHDIDQREAFDCSYTIFRNGLTFAFTLRKENLSVAGRFPQYVMDRLKRWQD